MKLSTFKGGVVLAIVFFGMVMAHAVVPDWWIKQNVIPATVDQTDPAVIQDNYKPALIGQAKHMAYQAYLAMEAKQAGSAGPTIENMVMNFSTNPTDNYSPLLIGQLKAIAQPFYDRLSELGYDIGDDISLNTNGYPWSETTDMEDNYKPANLGQLKYVFSFHLELFPPNAGIEGGLIAHWNFDEASGTAVEDSSGNQNDGTLVAGAERASGYGLGRSVQFDVWNEQVSTGSIDIGDIFTISCYFQTEYESADLQTLIANTGAGWNTDGFRVFLRTDLGQIHIETGNGIDGDAAFSEVGLPLLEDVWNHVAIVVNRTVGQARIYFNGLDVTIDSSIRTDFNTDNEISMGGLIGGGLNLQGRIDELRIYNKALLAIEINNFFLAKIGSKHVAKKADLWLDANQGVETDEAGNLLVWRDQSGFGLDAIVRADKTAPEWVERGHFENAALEFNESDDLFVPGIAGDITEFSIVWYIKPLGNTSYNQGLSDMHGWGTFVFHTDENGNIYLGIDVPSRIVGGTGPNDAPIGVFFENHWHLMAFTFREGVGRFYHNGVLLVEKSGLAMPQNWNGLMAANANAYLGELLFFGSELELTEMEQLSSYFNEKYRYDEDQDRDGILDAWEIDKYDSLTAVQSTDEVDTNDGFDLNIDYPSDQLVIP